MSMRPGDTIADMFVVPGSSSKGADFGGAATLDIVPGRSNSVFGEEQQLVAVTRFGYGKRMKLAGFKSQRRGGRGVLAIKFKRDDDRLLALSPASELEELLLVTQKGTIVRQRLGAIPEQGRATTGVALQRLDSEDGVASVTIVPLGTEDSPRSR